ncbi:MAG: hypothetical protein IJX80_02060 [Clostridia bacterium]|nr:hypothetical protein [Clostridia bacterium]
MIVTFCGHGDFHKTKEYERKVLTFLEEKIGNQNADMYLGGYGNFDDFAYTCCKKYKETHPTVSLILVTPYITFEYQRNHLKYQKDQYDSILYPTIEDKPRRFAIYYRNQYMVEMADYIIAYVTHDWGGAYQTYQYAERKGKKIFNLSAFTK